MERIGTSGQHLDSVTLLELEEGREVYVNVNKETGYAKEVYSPIVPNPVSSDIHGRFKAQYNMGLKGLFEAWHDIGASFGWWHGLFYPCMGIVLGLLLLALSKALGGR